MFKEKVGRMESHDALLPPYRDDIMVRVVTSQGCVEVGHVTDSRLVGKEHHPLPLLGFSIGPFFIAFF